MVYSNVDKAVANDAETVSHGSSDRGAYAISHSCAGSLWKRQTRVGPAMVLR